MKLPSGKIQGLIIFSSVFLLLTLLVHFLVGRPIKRYSQRVRREFSQNQRLVQEAQELVRLVPNPQEAINSLRAKVAEFQTQGSVKKQIPKLMQIINSLANEQQLKLVLLKPREDINQGPLPQRVEKVYIEVVFESNYQQIGKFLDELKILSVPFQVESLSIVRIEQLPTAESKGKETNVGWVNLQTTILLSAIFG
ncbi:MAG: type 4a pilus biogenesis protein PilO [Candidatus Omnitrophica bacterium]|nr:type 4a pilus biogenesis protein PilO [Candidatus Omnitrophota bacterium]